jgi:hypothetical protein
MATAPTFQAQGTGASAGAASLTVNWPASHAIDDIAFLVVESQGNAPTLSTPAGFAAVTSLTTTGTRLDVWWCRATSSSMTSPVVAANTDHTVAQIITFRGAMKTGTPYEGLQTTVNATSSTTQTNPAVTTSGANKLIIGFLSSATDSSSAWHTSQTNAALTGLTERADFANNTGNGGGIAAWSGVLASAGSSGTTSNSITSTASCLATIALIGHDTVTAQVATASFSGVAGDAIEGGVTVTAQVGTATFDGVPGAADPGSPGGGDTVTAQIGTASFSGLAGTPTPGAATVAAQVAAAAFNGVAGTSTPGAVAQAAQVGTGAFSGVAGTPNPGGVSRTAQVATTAFSGVAGTATPGAATQTAQVGAATFTGVAGSSASGPVTQTAQIGAAAFTGVAGSASAGGGGPQTVTAQVGAATFTGAAGTSIPGGVSKAAQVGTGTFYGAPAQHGNALVTYQGSDVVNNSSASIANIAAVDALRDDFEWVGKFQIDSRGRKPPNWIGMKAGAVARGFISGASPQLWINDGTTPASVASSANLPATQVDGSTAIWMKLTHSGGVAKWWTAPATTNPGEAEPVGGTWTQLGTDRPFVKTISAGSNGAAHFMMAYGAGLAENGGGYLYRMIVRDGVGGTTLFDIDFSKAAPGAASFTEAISGRIVTIGSGASINMNPVTAVTVPAQIASATLTSVAGAVTAGPTTKVAQVAAAAFTGVPGSFRAAAVGGHGTATIATIGTATATVAEVVEGAAVLALVGAASVTTRQPDSVTAAFAAVGSATAEVVPT